MICIPNIDAYPIDESVSYGGNAGKKFGVIAPDGQRWLIKFPKSARQLASTGPNLASYTTSPISEYVGSQIYRLCGIDVHETRLAVRDGKVVVACRDFNRSRRFFAYGEIKNTAEDFDSLTSSGSSGQGEYLGDALTVLKSAPAFLKTPGATERFWDMFIVDALIRNNDRNNGNWGVFLDADGKHTLAPVFDNGNAFFNKRNDAAFERRIDDIALITQDAIGTGVSFFLDEKGDHINPFRFIESHVSDEFGLELAAAAQRIMLEFSLEGASAMIDEIPQTIVEWTEEGERVELPVISHVQASYYKAMLTVTWQAISAMLL